MKECVFCDEFEKGDSLYSLSEWNGRVGYEYIRNIQYCPLCGNELKEHPCDRVEK